MKKIIWGKQSSKVGYKRMGEVPKVIELTEVDMYLLNTKNTSIDEDVFMETNILKFQLEEIVSKNIHKNIANPWKG